MGTNELSSLLPVRNALIGRSHLDGKQRTRHSTRKRIIWLAGKRHACNRHDNGCLPRENCITPAIVLIVWTTDTKNGCGLAPDTLRPQSDYPLRRERHRTQEGHRRDGCGQGWSRDRSVRYNWIASYRTTPLVIGGKTTQRHSLLVVIKFSIRPGTCSKEGTTLRVPQMLRVKK